MPDPEIGGGRRPKRRPRSSFVREPLARVAAARLPLKRNLPRDAAAGVCESGSNGLPVVSALSFGLNQPSGMVGGVAHGRDLPRHAAARGCGEEVAESRLNGALGNLCFVPSHPPL